MRIQPFIAAFVGTLLATATVATVDATPPPFRTFPNRSAVVPRAAPMAYPYRPYVTDPVNPYLLQAQIVNQRMVNYALYQEALRRQYLYEHFYVLPRLRGALNPYPMVGGDGGNGSGGD